MTGINRILNEIISDAGRESARVKAAAQENADKLKLAARTNYKEQLAELTKKADENAEKHKKRILSSAQTKKRLIILQEKQSIMNEMLDRAYSSLCNMPHDNYVQLICKLADKALHSGKCTIYFSKKDLEDEELINKVISCAQKADCAMKVSETPRNIDGGFVIAYGGVEENCSFDVLYQSYKNTLYDKANKILFAD